MNRPTTLVLIVMTLAVLAAVFAAPPDQAVLVAIAQDATSPSGQQR